MVNIFKRERQRGKSIIYKRRLEFAAVHNHWSWLPTSSVLVIIDWLLLMSVTHVAGSQWKRWGGGA
jgi:hypothetical protein